MKTMMGEKKKSNSQNYSISPMLFSLLRSIFPHAIYETVILHRRCGGKG